MSQFLINAVVDHIHDAVDQIWPADLEFDMCDRDNVVHT